jgi:hypothetical protein
MRIFRTAIAGITLSLLAASASAQQFPTVPDRTVIGRIGTGSGSGPSQAIPFATLLTNLASPLPVLNGGTGLSAASGTSLPLWSTGATGGPLAYRAIVGTDLPNPSTTTLGAVFSLPVASNSVLSGIGNDGVPTLATTTGTGSVVRATAPTIAGPTITGPSITGGAAIAGTVALTGTSTTLLSAGRLGITTPVLNLDSSNASSITGINIVGQATGNGVNITAIGETNVPIVINAAGNGTINLNSAGTGVVNSFRNFFINHDTNPTITLGSVGGSLAHLSTPGTSGLAITTGGGDQVNIVSTASANRQVTLTGSNGGNPTIATTAGNLAITPAVALNGGLTTPLAKAQGGTANTAESWQYIETLTASASATLTTSTFTSAFDDYVFVFDNIVPATDSVGFNATVESGGSFQATTYLNATALTTAIDVETLSTMSNSAGKGFNGTLFLNNVNSTSVNKFMTGRGVLAVTATFVPTSINVAGYWNGGQGAVTRLRFQMSSGNISTGTIKVYGIRNN